MRKLIILLILACLNGPFAAAQNPEPVALSDSSSWCMVLIPDPQTYTKFDYNHPTFELMMHWIKQNKRRLNIRLVLCTGDLVEQNQRTVPDGVNGNLPSDKQWQFVSDAFGILDDVVPYILCTGNHDHGFDRAENRYSQLNSFFPANRKSLYTGLLKGMFKNEAGIPTLENAWYEFQAPGGDRFLIVSLEFNPRAAVVAEAKALANKPEYSEHKVIYLTHSYMDSKGRRIEKEGYKITDVTCGKALWEKLVEPSANSSMVLCGHVVDEMSHRGHVGFRTDKNRAGRTVNQMMVNAQAEGGGWHGNGGDGWLRILEFHPDGKTVTVHTFSPLFAVSPSTVGLSLRTEPYDHFSFSLE